MKFTKTAAIAFIQVIWSWGTAMNVPAAESNYELKPISLPGANGAVALDYFAYNAATGKLWVPASNTGNVDAIDDGDVSGVGNVDENSLTLCFQFERFGMGRKFD